MSRHAMSSHVMSSHAMSSHVMGSHVMSSHVMNSHVMNSHVTQVHRCSGPPPAPSQGGSSMDLGLKGSAAVVTAEIVERWATGSTRPATGAARSARYAMAPIVSWR